MPAKHSQIDRLTRVGDLLWGKQSSHRTVGRLSESVKSGWVDACRKNSQSKITL